MDEMNKMDWIIEIIERSMSFKKEKGLSMK